MVAKKIAQIAEVASDEGEPFVIHNVLLCVFVLVETIQADACIALPEDFLGVSSSSEGYIHIDAFGCKVHPVDAFAQQDRYMICLFFSWHNS
jgi:hypothetical protein